MATDDMITETPTEDEVVEEATKWYYQTITDFYTRVKMALSAGNTIPNVVIDYFENAPRAELVIKKRVPQWETLDENQLLLFDTCVVYMTCYNLCPLVNSNRMTKMKDPSLEITYSVNTNDNPCARFMDLVDDLVAQLNGVEQQPFFWGFKVTPPTPDVLPPRGICGCVLHNPYGDEDSARVAKN